ncbi:MAG: rhodanese-like domain-containing protein [Sulfobacillus sp.]
MPALDTAAFAAALADGAVALDLRPAPAWAAGHIPESLTMQFGRLDVVDRMELCFRRDATYLLVIEPAALGPVAEKLIGDGGYQVGGYLAGGMTGWTAAGLAITQTPTVEVAELNAQLTGGLPVHLLDVRESFEFDWLRLPGAVNVPYGEIWDRHQELDAKASWVVICADQMRSATAISVLQRLGFERMTLVMGGLASWTEAGFPVLKSVTD